MLANKGTIDDIILKYRNAQEIRILPHDKTTFPTLSSLLSFLKGKLIKRDGIYYYPKKAMNFVAPALVLFQYSGQLVGSAMLLDKVQGKCSDEDGNNYDGHYKFDVNTLLLFYDDPITAKEYHQIDPKVDCFSRAMFKTDISKLDRLLDLIVEKA